MNNYYFDEIFDIGIQVLPPNHTVEDDLSLMQDCFSMKGSSEDS